MPQLQCPPYPADHPVGEGHPEPHDTEAMAALPSWLRAAVPGTSCAVPPGAGRGGAGSSCRSRHDRRASRRADRGQRRQ